MIPPPTGFEVPAGPPTPAFEPAPLVVGHRTKASVVERVKSGTPDPSLESGAPLLNWMVAVLKDASTYPWREQGWAILIPGAVLAVILGIGGNAPGLGVYAVAFSLGLIGGLYFKIIGTTIGGDDQMPDWPSLFNWSDMVASAGQVAGASLASYGPLVVYAFAIPASERSATVEWLLAVYGFCYHPMACINLVMEAGAESWLPHKVLPAILRCLPGYLVGVLPLAIFAGFAVLPMVLRSKAKLISLVFDWYMNGFGLSFKAFGPLALFALTWLCLSAVSFYLSIAHARIVGLIGRRFRDRLGWG